MLRRSPISSERMVLSGHFHQTSLNKHVFFQVGVDTHRIHVLWYIYLHLVDVYGKCRLTSWEWLAAATLQGQETVKTSFIFKERRFLSYMIFSWILGPCYNAINASFFGLGVQIPKQGELTICLKRSVVQRVHVGKADLQTPVRVKPHSSPT